jgi:adenylosuccinate synthase
MGICYDKKERSMSRIAYGVIDLGFGDSGKGTIVDFLIRHTGAKLVVRFNGGAQAGHNVVTTDGKHHTFSQFGSGSLVPGVKTVLSQDVAIHPIALQAEAKHLESLGVANPMENLIIHEKCLITTPRTLQRCPKAWKLRSRIWRNHTILTT